MISTGVVTTFAGSTASGSSDGTGTSASFRGPTGITTDGTNLYVTDVYTYVLFVNGNITTSTGEIRNIAISTGTVTTLAGTINSFSDPVGITSDGTSLFVADVGYEGICTVK